MAKAKTAEAPPTAFPVWMYHVDGRKIQAQNADDVAALEALGFTLEDPNFQDFPRWVYHTDGRRQVVQTTEEQEALGAGWTELPPTTEEAPKGAGEVKAPEPLTKEHTGHYRTDTAPTPVAPRGAGEKTATEKPR